MPNRIRISKISFISMLIALSGCSHTISFRLSDGSTLKPLKGVHTEVHFERASINSSYADRREIAATSDENGIVVIHDIPAGTSWTTTITFGKEGFYEAGAYYTGIDGISVESRAPPTIEKSGQIFHDDRIGDEIVSVYLFPADPNEKDHSLRNWRR